MSGRAAALEGTYYALLAELHRRRRPRLYLEIGVHQGTSLALALPTTEVVGVDPDPQVETEPRPGIEIVAMTSDEFFASDRAPALLGGQRLDMVFVDGLHHHEQVLADLAHVEPYCYEGTLVAIHDCLPRHEDEATRAPTQLLWAGDVWKAVVWLLEHRRDLAVALHDVDPTGLAVVTGFGGGAGRAPTAAELDGLGALRWSDYERWRDQALRRHPPSG